MTNLALALTGFLVAVLAGGVLLAALDPELLGFVAGVVVGAFGGSQP